MSQRVTGDERPGRGAALPVAFGLLIVGAVAALLLARTYDVWGAVWIAPLLVLLTLPALSRQARREGDRTIYWLLVLALLIKLAGAIVRHFYAFDVYGGAADAANYDMWGERISASFRDGVFDTGLPGLVGTDFIRFLTGLVYTVTGPTILGGFLIFSWLGFWGLFLFYRAFRIAVPEGRPRTYGRLVFFLPSLVYWPSSIGKEAWLLFALGIAAFGVAKVLAGKTVRGLPAVLIGLWLVGMVRPHIAGMVGVAFVGGYVMRRSSPDLRLLAPIAKGATVLVLIVAAFFLVRNTDRFLREAEVSSGKGLAATLANVADRTGRGGSQFAPSIFERPSRAPIAAFTVLFRPLPFEAKNSQAMLAALEASFLLLLTLFRLSWLGTAIGSVRRQPYLAFCLLFAGVFVVGFSAIANFGLLARERVQLLPFVLALVCVPSGARLAGERKEEEERAYAGR